MSELTGAVSFRGLVVFVMLVSRYQSPLQSILSTFSHPSFPMDRGRVKPFQRRRVLFRSGSHRRLKGNFGGFDWNDPGSSPDQPSPSKFSRHRHHQPQTKRARSARLIELRLTRSTPCTLSGAGTT